MRAVLVLSTCPKKSLAQKIAKKLLEEKLAACVQISSPIQSWYSWKSKIENTQEVQLWIKTTQKIQTKCIRRIKELHVYQIPEVLCFEVKTGLPAYLDWLSDSLGRRKN